jgi:hypothetical protein
MTSPRLLLVLLMLVGESRAQGDAGEPVATERVPHSAAAPSSEPADAGTNDPGPADRPSPSSWSPSSPPSSPTSPSLTATVRRWPVLLDGQPTPLSFAVALQGREARERAAEATEALAAALENEAPPEVRPAHVVLRDDVAVVKVKGRAIATLTLEDAQAAGASSLPAWAEEQETRLVDVVGAWQRRRERQSLAFHFFLSITLVVVAVLTLRGLNRALARADAALEDRTSPIKPWVLFGLPVLSSDATRGLLATGLLVGRGAGFVAVILATLSGVLAQFATTRPVLERIVAAGLLPIVQGLEALVAAVPGLVLAIVLTIAVRAGLRFVRVLLDGVAAGRIQSSLITKRRAPIARVVAGVVVVVVALPLIAAAAFGRFGTPLETLAVSIGVVVVIATVPVVASAMCGVVVAWRELCTVGEWVEVGGRVGEVASIGLTELLLVPPDGGTIAVPMLSLAVSPLRRLPRPPEHAQLIRLERRGTGAALLAQLTALVHGVDPAGGAELQDADAETVLVRLWVPQTRADGRQALSAAVWAAIDDGAIVLASGRRER